MHGIIIMNDTYCHGLRNCGESLALKELRMLNHHSREFGLQKKWKQNFIRLSTFHLSLKIDVTITSAIEYILNKCDIIFAFSIELKLQY